MLRADDSMLLVLQLHDHEPPLLLVVSVVPGGVFGRVTARFSVLWEEAVRRVEAAATIAAQPTAFDGPRPRRWPRRPTA